MHALHEVVYADEDMHACRCVKQEIILLGVLWWTDSYSGTIFGEPLKG
jgi:hypothetical protein